MTEQWLPFGEISSPNEVNTPKQASWVLDVDQEKLNQDLRSYWSKRSYRPSGDPQLRSECRLLALNTKLKSKFWFFMRLKSGNFFPAFELEIISFNGQRPRQNEGSFSSGVLWELQPRWTGLIELEGLRDLFQWKLPVSFSLSLHDSNSFCFHPLHWNQNGGTRKMVCFLLCLAVWPRDQVTMIPIKAFIINQFKFWLRIFWCFQRKKRTQRKLKTKRRRKMFLLPNKPMRRKSTLSVWTQASTPSM